MKPTQILSNEHRIIEQVLSCVEAMANQARETGKLDTEAASQTLDFFKTFVDKCHHAKEEDHLFPLMEAKGFSKDFGPTSVMRGEHLQGRGFIEGMSQGLSEIEAGNAEGVNTYVRNALEYIELLRQHVHKEDHCLFSMADNAFTAEDNEKLIQSFKDHERHEMGLGVHEKFLLMANNLAEKWGVEKACSGHQPSGGCCAH